MGDNKNIKNLENKLNVNSIVSSIKFKNYNNIGLIIYSMLDLFKEIN